VQKKAPRVPERCLCFPLSLFLRALPRAELVEPGPSPGPSPGMTSGRAAGGGQFKSSIQGSLHCPTASASAAGREDRARALRPCSMLARYRSLLCGVVLPRVEDEFVGHKHQSPPRGRVVPSMIGWPGAWKCFVFVACVGASCSQAADMPRSAQPQMLPRANPPSGILFASSRLGRHGADFVFCAAGVRHQTVP